MTDSIRYSSKKKKKKKKKKNVNLYKTFTRRTPNGIMDGCIRKVNQKVNRQIDSSFETICMKCQIIFYGKIPAKF